MSAIALPTPLHAPAEVIDVDLFDEPDALITPFPRRRRLSGNRWTPVGSSSGRDVIIVDSGDEEDEVIVVSEPSSSSRRLRSPPAPARLPSVPPPLPPFPHPLSSHRQGVVRPNDNSYLQSLSARFENAGSSTPRAPVSTGVSAAPRSHHMPNMGLGGAFVSRLHEEARQREAYEEFQRQHRRRRHEDRLTAMLGLDNNDNTGWGFRGSRSIRGYLQGWFSGAESDDGSFEGVPNEFARPFMSFTNRMAVEGDDAFDPHTRHSRPSYQSDYTHKDPPAPGFTHDFDPVVKETEPRQPPRSTPSVVIHEEGEKWVIEDTEPNAGPSSSSFEPTATVLICANCGDLLVLGASGSQKLWALRCGHMLDGKCIESLMHPSEPHPAELPPLPNMTDIPPADGKNSKTMRQNRNGKGRARVNVDSTNRLTDASHIRSRLRPRPDQQANKPQPTDGQVTSTHLQEMIEGARRRVMNRRRSKGKGKAPQVRMIAEHTWTCPVLGCQRQHASELLEGGDGNEGRIRWAHRVNEGPIPVFA